MLCFYQPQETDSSNPLVNYFPAFFNQRKAEFTSGEETIHTLYVIITVGQFRTNTNVLKLHDSLIVSNHYHLIQKETELMIEILINDLDLKTWSQVKLIALYSELKVNVS